MYGGAFVIMESGAPAAAPRGLRSRCCGSVVGASPDADRALEAGAARRLCAVDDVELHVDVCLLQEAVDDAAVECRLEGCEVFGALDVRGERLAEL